MRNIKNSVRNWERNIEIRSVREKKLNMIIDYRDTIEWDVKVLYDQDKDYESLFEDTKENEQQNKFNISVTDNLNLF